jgi:agmatinase
MPKARKTILPSDFDPDGPAPAESGIYGLPFAPDDSKVVIVPVPFEATTSYGGGTSNGPAAVLEASKQVDLFDQETGRPYARGIAMLDIPKKVERWNRDAKRIAATVIEKGGVVDRLTRNAAEKVNEFGDRLNAWVYDETVALLRQGKLAVVLGGDHSVPYGAIRAHAQKYPGLGILHLDAHADYATRTRASPGRTRRSSTTSCAKSSASASSCRSASATSARPSAG